LFLNTKKQEKDNQGLILRDQVKSDKINLPRICKLSKYFKKLELKFSSRRRKSFTTFYCTALDSGEHGLNLLRGQIKINQSHK